MKLFLTILGVEHWYFVYLLLFKKLWNKIILFLPKLLIYLISQTRRQTKKMNSRSKIYAKNNLYVENRASPMPENIEGDNRYFICSSEIRAKDFECSCQGVKDEKCSSERIPIYQKPITRTKCKARLTITRVRDGEWTVKKSIIEHNHEMFVSDQKHLLRSSRNISHAQKSALKAMYNVGIPIANAFPYMKKEAQGPQNLGFVRKDAYNRFNRLRRNSKVKDGGASELLQCFINKSNNEHLFFWNVHWDDNRIMNFFFRDYRCKVDYECFGDVVSVNTTYRTNRYDLICVPVVGINHHKQNVTLGLAFMSDETKSSFEWLFTTFLKSMNGKEPEIVFTDQCQAMINVVDIIFP
ncbi:hypothetical protein BUALT_Bualt04G0077500 [Buddleja alternifolia]|uniref:Protein FAR1-RELATED SEQUENCE n=1 Tax=Buddleja alternifolia TaxID=168488 RepID=A0AAV6XNI0_9LAMI|nr:hypothetical protein BUALT_Bualt04G0077500 [Buddleja alternifolia]